MVDRTSRGGDHDVDAALERAELAADRLSAEDGKNRSTRASGVLVSGLLNLYRQLSGRDQDQSGGRTGFRLAVEAGQYRQSEGGGLAGACRGLAEQVAAGK